MNKEILNKNQFYSFLPFDIEGIDLLIELALDIRWSWCHEADELWEQLDPELWQLTHNPWMVLQTVSRDKLESQLADAFFKAKIKEMMQAKETTASQPAWFQQTHVDSPLTSVAYFSMEFMLSEALPIYTGGLGNVAGDQLKAASDLGVPVVAIGLLYQQGYFRQEIDANGEQQAVFPYNDPGQLPIAPLRLPNGEWLRVKIELPGYPVWLRTWQVQVGRVKLYLLDSNDAANLPVHRGITSELYGGGAEMRIKQEILLGIGGWRLLKALGIKPEVCHMNEGHAAFVVLERARDFMRGAGISFEAALAVTRAGNLFTTHTAVAAGFDHFSPALMYQFLGAYCKEQLGVGFDELMALGRLNRYNTSESFNMAYLAIRGSGQINGVSRLHGVVSRQLFQNLFSRWPVEEVPVGYVTNGVHVPSWDSEIADNIWTQACGKDRWRGNQEGVGQNVCTLTDETLWQMRNTCRANLVNYTRNRVQRQLTISGQPPSITNLAKQVFDPNTLTLGFARRFVAYKRPNLLLHDEQRFIRILTNQQYPVQLIIAGKAPPFDDQGRALIQQWVQFIHKNNLYRHVIFLSDYDMLLSEKMVQGADVWVNTPRRPWEACGTSGMKVLVNGGINLSELDGWWAEAYTPAVGWALGDEQEHGDDPAWDGAEARKLYDLLENEIVPEFYGRNQNGIPVRWVERMRQSMSILTPQFSANRAVREYTNQHYLPAAASYLKRAKDNGADGVTIVKARQQLGNNWYKIAFGEAQIKTIENGYMFIIYLSLNGLNPALISVELYAQGINGGPPEKVRMNLYASDKGEYVCQASVLTPRPATHYTARIIPAYASVSMPLEDQLILWQH